MAATRSRKFTCGAEMYAGSPGLLRERLHPATASESSKEKTI